MFVLKSMEEWGLVVFFLFSFLFLMDRGSEGGCSGKILWGDGEGKEETGGNGGMRTLDIDYVEAGDGCVEADICLGDLVAVVVGAGGCGEVLLDAVEVLEEGHDGFFVGGLGAGDC